MARFSEQFIQQVAQATDIIDLVSQFVALKKGGKDFVGLCPFHNDHKPSMSVSPAKQIFKCFSCGAGGGVFQFMMLHEKLTFPEAVENLAERAHIPLPREANVAPAPAGMSKDDLTRVMTWAAHFYQEQLVSPSGHAAMEYARKRGLTDESIKRFGLGFAPAFWDGLLRQAQRDGVAQSQLLACGLVIQRDQGEGQREGCYDRFRNRLLFPIHDIAGKVIAFGGRALAADEKAKYLNSPETQLFDKSGQLYALNWSREGVSKRQQAVVVEGYMDAVMPMQCGLDNVVATLGTALTDRHIRLLSRYAREVVLVYDADAAGVAAAERAVEMFLVQQMHVRVASIPEGKDPCDFCMARGGQAMRELIDSAPDALAFVWNRRLDQYLQAGGNLADRRKVMEDFLRLVVSSSVFGTIDELRRGQLAQHIAHILNISAGDVQQLMREQARMIPRASAPSAARSADSGASQRVHLGNDGHLSQRQVLEVLLNRPDLFDQAAERIGVEDFGEPLLARVAREVWKLGLAGKLSMDELLPLESLADCGDVVAELATAGESRGNHEATLQGAVDHLAYCRQRRSDQAIRSGGLTEDTLRHINQSHLRPDVRRFPKIR